MTQAKQEGSTVRELMDEVARLKAERDAEAHSFKNLHRLLCDRFDYTHDETDWKRDQLSLIEWIASRIATLTARNAELVKALKPFACDCSKEGFGRCERAEWMSPSTACAWFAARRILEASHE